MEVAHIYRFPPLAISKLEAARVIDKTRWT